MGFGQPRHDAVLMVVWFMVVWLRSTRAYAFS
jgi:hypothetical protein